MKFSSTYGGFGVTREDETGNLRKAAKNRARPKLRREQVVSNNQRHVVLYTSVSFPQASSCSVTLTILFGPEQ